jgi:hypothetical protein
MEGGGHDLFHIILLHRLRKPRKTSIKPDDTAPGIRNVANKSAVRAQ